MPALIPDDVVALGRVYGFSTEGYVNFEPARLRSLQLEATPLMKAIKDTERNPSAEGSDEVGRASATPPHVLTPDNDK